MSTSAKQLQTLRAIRSSAVDLAIEHGFDGFTVDDLAVRSGVSRRTVFNYVSGKEDAVLGPQPQVDEDDRRTFREGGPTGDLLADIEHLLISVLPDVERADSAVARKVFGRNPELLVRLYKRIETPLSAFGSDIAVRLDRPVDHPEVRMAVACTVTLAHQAIEAFNSGSRHRSFPDVLHTYAEAMRAIAR